MSRRRKRTIRDYLSRVMVKYFCDGCGCEINADTHEDRLSVTVGKGGRLLRVQVIHAQDDIANQGLYCKHCILDALYELDDRPKTT